jgi:hypothetical protein
MGKRKFVSNEGIIDSTSLPKQGASSGSTGISASGPSSQWQPPQKRARTSSSTTKKPRKDAQDLDVTVPEKRGAIFKKSCPKNILDRVARVMSQR